MHQDTCPFSSDSIGLGMLGVMTAQRAAGGGGGMLGVMAAHLYALEALLLLLPGGTASQRRACGGCGQPQRHLGLRAVLPPACRHKQWH
jgi:hypothetical protein